MQSSVRTRYKMKNDVNVNKTIINIKKIDDLFNQIMDTFE